MSTVTIQTSDDGVMTISASRHRSARPEDFAVYLPILKKGILDTHEGLCPDALNACSKYVPEIKGISDKFTAQFVAITTHKDAQSMLSVFEYTKDNLMYGLYNGNNPGHLYVAIQCFGGVWAGIASQTFATVLLSMCADMKRAANSSCSEIDMAIGVIGCICKSFGCSARTPLIPRFPEGSPPDPNVLLSDAICAKHSALKPHRDSLARSLRDWHIPKCLRGPKSAQIWQPHCQIDRTRAFVIASIQKR